MKTFAVITGGGTAGHVLPALAIAEELEERGHRPDTLLYIGAQPRHRDAPVPASRRTRTPFSMSSACNDG